MGYCIHHPEKKTIYRCSTCSSYICMDCLEKYRHPQKNKRMGFCSQECKDKYFEGQKGNRKKSLKYAIHAMYWLILALLILAVYPSMFVDSIASGGHVFNIDTLKIYAFLIFIGLSVRSFGKFYDLYRYGELATEEDDYPEPQPGPSYNYQKKISKVDSLSKNKIMDKLKRVAPYYIYLSDVDYTKVVQKIGEFLEEFGGQSGYKTGKHSIYIGTTHNSETYIYLSDTIDRFYFIHLLCMLDSVYTSTKNFSIVGYCSIKNETCMFNRDIDPPDAVFGCNAKGEFITVLLDDGSYTLEDSAREYIEPDPNYSEIKELHEYKVVLNDLSKMKSVPNVNYI